MLALVQGHAAELLRFARRFSLCADDAQDAYQRALEILLRRLRTSAVDNPLSYLRTIIRHEAYQVRVERERDLPRRELDAEAGGGDTGDDPSERVERFERLAHTAEALQRLKPQELKALTLRAQGLSYREICEREGWTYTRCNRVVSEGRRRLLTRLGAIESGDECARWMPLLSAFADGEIDARAVVELRPHLRACQACRATLGELHDAARGIRIVVPPLLLPPAVAAAGAVTVAGTAAVVDDGGFSRLEALAHGALERVTGSALRLQSAVEALPGAKVAAVAASTVAVAGGGAAIERAASESAGSSPPAHVASADAGRGSPAQRRTIATTMPSAGASTTHATVPSADSTGPEWPAAAVGGTPGTFGEFGFEAPTGPGSDAAPLAPFLGSAATAAAADADRLSTAPGDRSGRRGDGSSAAACGGGRDGAAAARGATSGGSAAGDHAAPGGGARRAAGDGETARRAGADSPAGLPSPPSTPTSSAAPDGSSAAARSAPEFPAPEF